MSVWLSPWDWTATDWAGVQAVVLVVAAAFAFWQVWEARRLRRAQVEPFVVVDFDVLVEQQEIYLVIANIGSTVARDVRLTFDPELTSSFDEKPTITSPRELKPLRDGIPSLPPGKHIRVLLDLFTQRPAETYADVFRVHIAFYAPALKRELTDDTVLDLGLYRNVLHVVRHDVHDVHKQLEKLVAEVGNIRKALPPQE